MNSGGRLGEAIKSYKSLWQTTFRTKSVIRAWLKVLLLIKLFYVKFNLFEEDCLFRVTCFGFFVVCLSNVSTWRISRLQDYKIFQQSLESWDKLKPAAVICYSFCHQALVLKSGGCFSRRKEIQFIPVWLILNVESKIVFTILESGKVLQLFFWFVKIKCILWRTV